MKKTSVIIFLIFTHFFSYSQKGKNGAGNIVASTVVNAYTSLTADAFIGNTTINVASSAGYAVGDLIYIIQMQGASVNCFINPFGNPNSAEPFTPAFGKITNYNNAGNNEYAQISSVAGNIITIDCPLKNNYTAAGRVQVLRVPRYTSLTIAAAGVITCPTWNGTTGGVIAIEVDGNTTINAGGRISATGLGFRGGAVIGKTVGSVFGGGAYGHNSVNEGGYKGEGIAGSVATYLANFNGPYCRGAVANAGGGGNGNNAGGGGGANAGDTLLYTGTGNPDISLAGYVTAWNLESPGFAASSSSGGGRGGYSYSNTNLNPRTNAPGLAGWTGDNRRVSGGLGGRPLNYNTGRLYCGGGGGAGDENDAFGGAGGNGGGIINIISYGTVTGTGQIIAEGQNGFNSLTPPPGFNVSGRDGAGGAGGGGAIVINSLGLINSITVSVKGGNGGNQEMRNGGASTAMAYGPGGGGGGGYIATTAAAITTNINGGVNGIVQYLAGIESCQIDNNPATNSFPANGSTIGGVGIVTTTLQTVPTITASPDVTICINNSTILTATTTGPPSTIGWYTNFAGPTLLGTGSAFTTSVFTTVGTYTVWAGFCPSGIYRDPVIITVTNGPTLTTSSQTICSGQTATISASGATTYTWNTGSTSPTINPSPIATTVYTVVGANGTCSTSTTATVTVNAATPITVNSATICGGQTATLIASGATTYTWNTGSNSATINPSPIATTVYTVNGSIGTCSTSATASVTVNSAGLITTNSSTICSGQTATISASGATTYTWNTGSNSATINPAPLATTVYTVNGSIGTCSASASATVTLNNISLSATSQTICTGLTATVVASGATTYTWNTGSNSATINPAPLATTIYTVIGANGTCSASANATVTVNSSGGIAVNSATICSGQTATLTAGAATSYTWSTTQNIQTINVSPLATTVYTVNATLGAGCNASNTSTVTVISNPTLSINNSSICLGQTATLSVVGALSYQWYDGSTASSNTMSPITTTSYSLTGASGGCTATATASVFVTPNPTVSATSVSICAGQTASLVGLGATTYTWDPIGINSIGSTFSVSPVSSTIYSLSGSTNGCVGSATVGVNVGSNLSISVNNATICSGQSATLTAISSATNYSWSNGSLTNQTIVNPVVSTTYSINGNFAGCTGSTTANVFVTQTPTLTSLNPTLCSGQSATLNALGATNYTWSTASTATTIIVNPVTNTTYSLIGANGSCTASANFNVIVGSLPSILTNSASICNGSSATLTANGATSYTWLPLGTSSSTISVNPSSNTNYTVIGSNGTCTSLATASVEVTNGGTVSVSGATVCNGQNALIGTSAVATSYLWSNGATTPTITVSPNTTTNYSLQVILGGCTLTGSTTVVITPAPIINATGASICLGDNATIFASGANNYTWSPGNLTGSSINVSPIVTTNFIVSSYSNGCTSTATAQVQVNSKPSLTVTPQNKTVCPNTPVTFFASGAAVYDWYVDGSYYFGNPLTFTPKKTSTISVVGSNGGCSSSTVTNVNVLNINASFNSESNYVDYPGSLSFTNTSSGYTSILWDFGNGQTSTNNNATAIYEYPGTYLVTLLAKDTVGCADTTFYLIEAGCGKGDIYIPNTFTPNNDGLNDTFRVFGGTCLTNFSGTIFDRWGNEIYKFKNLTDAWDGKIKGVDIEIGVYNYLINYTLYNGKQFTKTGIISVLR
jgi:gliding motility-associated-like protein